MDDSQQCEAIQKTLPGIVPLKHVASGSYGAVYIAREQTGRLVAVKFVECQAGDLQERERRGLQLYCTKLRSHPNLISIYQTVFKERHFCYVMELADNFNDPTSQDLYCPDTLAQRLQANGPLKFDDLVEITLGLLDGLQALHAAGLIHRDIKPGNIIFINGKPKIGDIGLIASNTTESSLAGTPVYQPPQAVNGQISAFGENDPDADLYALGKTLYCMMTGRSAKFFPELPKGMAALPNARLQALNRFINHACDADRKKRFANLAEFREEFMDTVVGHGKKRSAWRWILINAVVFLAIVGLTAWLLPRSPRPARNTPPPSQARRLLPPESILNAQFHRVHDAKLIFNGTANAHWNVLDQNGAPLATAATTETIRSFTLVHEGEPILRIFDLYLRLDTDTPCCRLQFNLTTDTGAELQTECFLTRYGTFTTRSEADADLRHTAADNSDDLFPEQDDDGIRHLHLYSLAGESLTLTDGNQPAGQSINVQGTYRKIAITVTADPGGNAAVPYLCAFYSPQDLPAPAPRPAAP